MSPFQPVTGEQSRRSIALELLAARSADEVVTYEELAEALGVDDRPIAQAAVNTAKLALERDHNKAVAAVKDVGYRVVHASEQLGLAKRHQVSSRRQLVRARSKVKNIDMAKLTEGEKAAVTLAATALGLQIEYARRADIRAGNLEDAVAKLTEGQGKSADAVAELMARLEKLESKLSAKDEAGATEVATFKVAAGSPHGSGAAA